MSDRLTEELKAELKRIAVEAAELAVCRHLNSLNSEETYLIFCKYCGRRIIRRSMCGGKPFWQHRNGSCGKAAYPSVTTNRPFTIHPIK